MARQPGAYLIHFDQPIRHAQHYLGSAADIPARYATHLAGNGAKIVTAVRARGISIRLARTWPTATRALAWQTEIALKNRRDSPRFCPICTPGTGRAAAPAPTTVRTWHRARR